MIHYTANGENTISSNSCNNFEHFYQLSPRSSQRPSSSMPSSSSMPFLNLPLISTDININDIKTRINTITQSIILTNFLNEILLHGDNHAEFKAINIYPETDTKLEDSANALNKPLLQIKVILQILNKALVELTYLLTLYTVPQQSDDLTQKRSSIQKANTMLSETRYKIGILTDTMNKIKKDNILLVSTIDLDYILFLIKNIDRIL